MSRRRAPDGFSISNYRPWLYMGLTFLWSWTLLWIPVGFSLGAADFPVAILRAASGAGPMIVTLYLVYSRLDADDRADYWVRLVSFRHISPALWLMVFLFPLAIVLSSGAIDQILGGTGLQLEAAERFVEQPLAILPYALFILAFGPLPEEMGWRGYALPALQARWSPLVSSVVLGVIWALWHLPLFFIPGTYQANLVFLSPSFWWFMLGMIPETILMTWVFNHCRGSTLSAVLIHFAINFTGELFMLSSRGDVIAFLMWCVAAGMVAILSMK